MNVSRAHLLQTVLVAGLLFPAQRILADEVTDKQKDAVGQEIEDAFGKAEKAAPVDWAAVRAPVDQYVAAHPDDKDDAGLVKDYMYTFESAHSLAESRKEWASYDSSKVAGIAEAAKLKAGFFALADAPLELNFTGLDGKPVDLAQLRGKIVLLDFWATWCPPCMAELPNVKRIYEKYHARGFEIVGISCDVSPDQANGKVEKWMKTGPQVLEFTQTHGMPWPQNYEGKKHNAGGNSVSAKFAVTGIPAAFLIGRDGRIEAMNLRGDNLDKAVGDALSAN